MRILFSDIQALKNAGLTNETLVWLEAEPRSWENPARQDHRSPLVWALLPHAAWNKYKTSAIEALYYLPPLLSGWRPMRPALNLQYRAGLGSSAPA
jgi:hypothetical protein